MPRSHPLLVAAVAAVTIAAADRPSATLPPNAEIIARVRGQELTGERLAGILARGQLRTQRDIATALTEFWVSYQVLGYLAARNDSLKDPQLVDQAMWASISQLKISKYYEVAKASFPAPDTINLAEQYDRSPMLSAQHILIAFPEGAGAEKKEEIRQKADDIRRRATTANFGALVKEFSNDSGSLAQDGKYVLFPPGRMQPAFENAVRETRPGEINSALAQTTYGYHIVRRLTVDEVRSEFTAWLLQNTEPMASARLLDSLLAQGRIAIRPGITAKVRDLARLPAEHENDRTILATSRLGNFTGGHFVRWMLAHPQSTQLRDAIVNRFPDSLIAKRIEGFLSQELLIAEADKHNVRLDSAELVGVRTEFLLMVTLAWDDLKISPKLLSEGATTVAERQRLAAARADEAMEKISTVGEKGFVAIPPALIWALRMKGAPQINRAGVARAADRAVFVRAAMDSTRARR